MYGTVARIRIKAGKEQELARLSREQVAGIPGFVFEHLYSLDRDAQDYYLVVAFESKDAYRANAESPEQHARYEQYRALLEDEPRWHDGEIVSSFPE